VSDVEAGIEQRASTGITLRSRHGGCYMYTAILGSSGPAFHGNRQAIGQARATGLSREHISLTRQRGVQDLRLVSVTR